MLRGGAARTSPPRKRARRSAGTGPSVWRKRREVPLAAGRAGEGITQGRSGYYPRVGLFGVYDKARETILNPRGEFVYGGIEATWTLWEWGRTNHEGAQAER